MQRAKGQQVAADRAQLEQEITLIRAPTSLLTQEAREKLKIPVEQAEKMQE